jgi:glycosyltransferase involved in cell wall biosynthesis
MKIGIGITTRNRRETADKTIINIKKFLPKRSKLVIVDDASSEPYRGATYRFPFQAGIAKAKNKCLELLDDCDYIFLFDDDCYPIREDWYQIYIDSKLNHASFNFYWNGDGMKIIDELPNNVVSWSSPRGCLMFFTKECLEKCGGMDEGFAIWGYEHPDYSRRVWLMNLNPVPFPDIKGSEKYFYSYDMHSAITSTVVDRIALINSNRDRYMKLDGQRRFVPYKKNQIALKPALLTCYLNGSRDPQRGVFWSDSPQGLRDLITTCQNTSTPLIVFHDCLDSAKDLEFVKFQRVSKNPNKSPLSQRWLIYKEYLEKNHHSQFFCIDATDIKVLKNPFRYIQSDRLYVGDEWNNTWINVWVEKYNEPHIKIKDYNTVKNEHSNKPLLNAGIVGGGFDLAFKIVSLLAETILKEPNDPNIHTDMGLINYFARKYFSDSLIHGDPVNTKFKQYEDLNRTAWFQHK